eukprot:8523803-Alexandrium_andersonii.AAC.1
MAELSRTLWERSRADPENCFRARQPAFVRAVMDYIDANRHQRVIYAPLGLPPTQPTSWGSWASGTALRKGTTWTAWGSP